MAKFTRSCNFIFIIRINLITTTCTHTCLLTCQICKILIRICLIIKTGCTLIESCTMFASKATWMTRSAYTCVMIIVVSKLIISLAFWNASMIWAQIANYSWIIYQAKITWCTLVLCRPITTKTTDVAFCTLSCRNILIISMFAIFFAYWNASRFRS